MDNTRFDPPIKSGLETFGVKMCFVFFHRFHRWLFVLILPIEPGFKTSGDLTSKPVPAIDPLDAALRHDSPTVATETYHASRFTFHLHGYSIQQTMKKRPRQGTNMNPEFSGPVKPVGNNNLNIQRP